MKCRILGLFRSIEQNHKKKKKNTPLDLNIEVLWLLDLSTVEIFYFYFFHWLLSWVLMLYNISLAIYQVLFLSFSFHSFTLHSWQNRNHFLIHLSQSWIPQQSKFFIPHRARLSAKMKIKKSLMIVAYIADKKFKDIPGLKPLT